MAPEPVVVAAPKRVKAPVVEKKKVFLLKPQEPRAPRALPQHAAAAPWSRPKIDTGADGSGTARRRRGCSRRQVEQPEWHLSWGIRLGEVLLPQLSIFGLANDDDDEEEEEEVVEVGRGGISVTSNNRKGRTEREDCQTYHRLIEHSQHILSMEGPLID